MRRGLVLAAFVAPVLLLACANGDNPPATGPLGGTDATTDSGSAEVAAETNDDGFVLPETGSSDADKETSPIDPDAACATASVEAKAELQPVDIIWMVDNSGSMKAAVDQVTKGLNAFAALIDTKKLDYKVIMLSKRGATSGTTYPVCIPPPLSGDTMCGNGPRFFHSSIDIKSTQPLEQFLGTLDQTAGYALGDSRGGEPWKDQLRPAASKTIVIVTDDDSRFSATDFETFPGGKNPFNSAMLPPGILDPSRKGLFDGYIFGGVYGWGSDTDPSVKCTYPDTTQPAAAGATYTTLVNKTKGPRAKICADAATEWPKFLDAVASAVVKSSKLACTLDLPLPTSGTLDPTAVNVQIEGTTGTTLVPKVKDAASCGSSVAWYYDDEAMPTKVLLCPAACDAANAAVGVDKPGKISILFGCKTIIK
ncbi:MAG: hypothetical protein ACXVEF_30945 [Polyangiales bacterium]